MAEDANYLLLIAYTLIDRDVAALIGDRTLEPIFSRGTLLYARIYIDGKRPLLHRWILSAPADQQVDHIDRNPLNNLRSNLRLCNAAVNNQNRASGGRSPYKGVFYDTSPRPRAVISYEGHKHSLGRFDSEEAAARAYDAAAIKFYGPHAFTNF